MPRKRYPVTADERYESDADDSEWVCEAIEAEEGRELRARLVLALETALETAANDDDKNAFAVASFIAEQTLDKAGIKLAETAAQKFGRRAVICERSREMVLS